MGSALSHRGQCRLLALEGETGCVFCRVHDEQSKRTLPSRSEHGSLEFATRSLLRLRNLVAVRRGDGLCRRDDAMIGPGDYFCNVEAPHENAFTILFDEHQKPAFVRHPLAAAEATETQRRTTLRPATDDDVVRINAKWYSGKYGAADLERYLVRMYEPTTGDQGVESDLKHDSLEAGHDKKRRRRLEELKRKAFGQSLFDDPGILEMETDIEQQGAERGGSAIAGAIRFPAVDATQLDLSGRGFSCRLYRNSDPFVISKEALQAKDEFRPVSYEYGSRYADVTVREGGGLFLETHDFAQTMTPMDGFACGFIVIGRWVTVVEKEKKENNGESCISTSTSAASGLSSCDDGGGGSADPIPYREGVLELIAVRIPYGYTIVVDRGCIHGDTTFRGSYMMSMTSNHVTMSTADTVFLKCRTHPAAQPKHFSEKEKDGLERVDESTVAGTGPLVTNVRFVCPEHYSVEPTSSGAIPRAPRPIVVFHDTTLEELQEFKKQSSGLNFMLAPFSSTSWTTTLFRRIGWYPGMPAPDTNRGSNHAEDGITLAAE